ncbi:MAG: SPFH domain-containing protein, partial [Rhodobacteraceae bacterium]|nr:SPFH domain-containing protein [Paracoccaceae bacterium]
VSDVNMRTTRLEIERLGPKSIITRDRLRVDVAAEFYVRVIPTATGVATAAQALGSKSFRAGELAETLEGKLADAMLSIAATRTMDALQDDRAGYTREVAALLADNLAQNGLMLESVSLTRLDQTPFHALDENNAFNALGMRRLAEIIAVNKKERAVIEADAEVSVRQSQLEATKRKLTISREEEEAMIAQNRAIEIARARSHAETAQEQAASERLREAARIERERDVRMKALESELDVETARAANAVQLAAKKAEAAEAEARAIAARAGEATAEEEVRTARETAAAERDKRLALIRATEQAEVDDTRVKSEVGTLISMAEAEAKATLERAEATKAQMLAEAEGRAAVIAAENAQSPDLIAMKLDEARLKVLPEVVERMLKPAEKIETIRINAITGMGGMGGSGDAGGERSTVNQVVESVLSMALQLPAVQKLGEEVGMNIGDGVRGIAAPLAERGAGKRGSKSGGDTPATKD